MTEIFLKNNAETCKLAAKPSVQIMFSLLKASTSRQKVFKYLSPANTNTAIMIPYSKSVINSVCKASLTEQRSARREMLETDTLLYYVESPRLLLGSN